jgi:hypothetical protein
LVNRSSNEFNRVFPPYFRNSFGISSIPQAFPDMRLSRTDLMFSRWILSDMGISEIIRLNSLLDLFTKKILILKKIPQDWHKGIIRPIHKGGSMYNLDNYRGITLTSNVYKVYAKIIKKSVMSYMEDNGILGEVQGVFQTGQTDGGQHFYSTRDMCT